MKPREAISKHQELVVYSGRGQDYVTVEVQCENRYLVALNSNPDLSKVKLAFH